MKLKEELKSLGACQEAINWVGSRSRKRAWLECERGDWMLWYLEKTQSLPKETWVRLAVAFARSVLHLVPENESRPRLARVLPRIPDPVCG
jgi:hypothetical protein